MTSPLKGIKKKITPILEPVALAISKLGVRPNQLTLLALISGLLAVFFLLSDWMLFTIFAILNLIFDILDGAVARVAQSDSRQGRLFDFWNDRLIAYLLLAKGAYLGLIQNAHILGVITIVLGCISALWYFRSKKDLPIITVKGLLLILGIVKFSWLMIPVALILYSASLIWQIWYSLNNL